MHTKLVFKYYLVHTLVTYVEFVNLCSQVLKMARAEVPCAFQTTLDGQRKTYTWRHAAKPSSFNSLCNSHVSWRTLQRVGDHTLLQIWWPWTTLLIRYTESSSNRLAVIWIRKIALVRIILPLLSAY